MCLNDQNVQNKTSVKALQGHNKTDIRPTVQMQIVDTPMWDLSTLEGWTGLLQTKCTLSVSTKESEKQSFSVLTSRNGEKWTKMKDFELPPGTRFLKVVGKGGILKDPKVIFESPEYMWTDLRNSTFKIEGNAEIGCSLARQIVSLVREEDSNVEERLRKEFGVDCAIETLKQMRMRRGRTIELRRPLSAGTENDMHHLHIRQIAVYDTNGKQLELTMDSTSKTETNRGPFNAIDGSEKTMTESSPDDKNDLFLRYRIESTTTCVEKVVVRGVRSRMSLFSCFCYVTQTQMTKTQTPTLEHRYIIAQTQILEIVF